MDAPDEVEKPDAAAQEGNLMEKDLFNIVPGGKNGWALYNAVLVAKNLEISDKSEVSEKTVIDLVNRIKPLLLEPTLKEQIENNIISPDTLTQALEDSFIYKDKGFTSADDYIAGLSTLKDNTNFNMGPVSYPDIKLICGLISGILEVDIAIFKEVEENKYECIKVFKRDNSIVTVYLLYVNRDHIDILRSKSDDDDTNNGSRKQSLSDLIKAKKQKFKSALLRAKQGLKTLARSVGRGLKGLVSLPPGIINIAGVESVNTTDSPTGHVEFIGNYTPSKDDADYDPEKVQILINLFNRIFAGKVYSSKNPLLPPCEEADRTIFMDSLRLRLSVLVDSMGQGAIEQGITADISEKTDALARLELLLEQLNDGVKNGKCNNYEKDGSPEGTIKIKTAMDKNTRLWLRKVLFSALQVYNPVPEYKHLTQDARDTIAQLSKNPFTEYELGEYIKIWTEQQAYLGEGVPEVLGRILDELGVQPGLLDIMLTDELKNIFQQLINWVTEDYTAGFNDATKVQEFKDFSEGLKTSTLNIKQRIIELVRWITRKNIECWKELGIAQKELEDCRQLIDEQVQELADVDAKLQESSNRVIELVKRIETINLEVKDLRTELSNEGVSSKEANIQIEKLQRTIDGIRTLHTGLEETKSETERRLAESTNREAALQKTVKEKEAAAAAALEAQQKAATELQAATAGKENTSPQIQTLQAQIAKLTEDLTAAQAATASATATATKQLTGRSASEILAQAQPSLPQAPPPPPKTPLPPQVRLGDPLLKLAGVNPQSKQAQPKQPSPPPPKQPSPPPPKQPSPPPSKQPSPPPPKQPSPPPSKKQLRLGDPLLAIGQKGGGEVEQKLAACITEQQNITRKLTEALQRFAELQKQNNTFVQSLKNSQQDLEKMERLTASTSKKQIETERQLQNARTTINSTKSNAELKDMAQSEIISRLSAETESLKARIKQKEIHNKLDSKGHAEQVIKLQNELAASSNHAAKLATIESEQKMKIEELTNLSRNIATISDQETAKKMEELADLREQIEEIKEARQQQKATDVNKKFFIRLKEYATNLLDNGNTADPSGIVKGSPAFLELYKRTHALPKGPTDNAVMCFLHLFVKGLLKQLFTADTAKNKDKINSLTEACIRQIQAGDQRKDKITALMKVLVTLVDNYSAGTPFEDQAIYNTIFKEHENLILIGVPSISGDKDNIFFDNASPPNLAAEGTGLPFNVVFIMLLMAGDKYIQEIKSSGKFNEESCKAKPPVSTFNTTNK